MKISETFENEKLDQDFIEVKFNGSYWESCQKFVNDNWDREISSLSEKQQSWFNRILQDCIEKRLEFNYGF